MRKLIVTKKDKILEEHEVGTLKATPLFILDDEVTPSDQVFLEIVEGNKKYFKDHVKYTTEEILEARQNKTVLKEKYEEQVISCPQAFAMKTLPDGRKLFKRHGSFSYDEQGEATNPFVTVTAGESIDYDIEIDFDLTKLKGVDVVGAGDEHSCEFFVLTSDGLYELNQFGFNSALSKGLHKFTSEYDADIPLGLILRTTIYNWSNQDSKVAVNLDLNEVREA
jgi:hypothetical protein